MKERLLKNVVKPDSGGLWLLFVLLLIFTIRLFVVNVLVIDWDESVYFTISQDIVNGGVPYKTAWDSKGPILFFIFVPVILLFDESIAALRIFTTAYLLISMYFLYLLAGKLVQGFSRLLAPLTYGLFFCTAGLGGFASNGELFMLLPAILALLTYLDYERKGSLSLLFLSGIFTAGAFFIKGSAFFSVLVIPFFIIYGNLKRDQRNLYSFLKESVYYSLGIAAVSVALTAYFWIHGAVDDFYYTYFVLNARYMDAVPLTDALYDLIHFVYAMLFGNFDLITFLAVASSIFVFVRQVKNKFPGEEWDKLFFIAALAVLSLIGVLAGRRMFPHYYLQMALPYSIIIALGVSQLGLTRNYIKAATIVLIGAFMILNPVARDIKSIRNMDLEWYESEASYAVAGYIRSNTSEDETILVVGGQPVIYFLSDRRMSMKDFWWPNHHDVMFEILNLESSIPQALNNSRPEYIAFYEGKHEELITHLDYLDKFIDDHYTLEKEIRGYKLYRLSN